MVSDTACTGVVGAVALHDAHLKHRHVHHQFRDGLEEGDVQFFRFATAIGVLCSRDSPLCLAVAWLSKRHSVQSECSPGAASHAACGWGTHQR